ncbi:ABC transporter ATP-binding protein [Rhodobacteraceae bacterium F11138]|nr:ABC transporter ATP-binding protein [Rhodobacteraceae bacterium F11138]
MQDIRKHAQGAAGPTLSIRNLTVSFAGRRQLVQAVKNVSLDIWPGEIVGIIGESGSGKTMTALSAIRLLPHKAQVEGTIHLGERDVLSYTEKQMRALRGDRIAMIPQDAMQSLNPSMRIGRQVGEPIELHRKDSASRIKTRVRELLASVKIGDTDQRMQEYPHQFSGGMQQRAMIAMGLALDPELIIADEPTTALDVTVQAEVLRLLREIRDNTGTSIAFITHELGIVAELCDWVYVMNKGEVVEQGCVDQIFNDPQADYTRMLLDATPSIHGPRDEVPNV